MSCFFEPLSMWHTHGHQTRSQLDNWGALIHIFVFTDCKNNRFQRKWIMQNTNIWIRAPPIIELATRLMVIMSWGFYFHVMISFSAWNIFCCNIAYMYLLTLGNIGSDCHSYQKVFTAFWRSFSTFVLKVWVKPPMPLHLDCIIPLSLLLQHNRKLSVVAAKIT